MSTSLSPKEFSIIRYLERVSWDNHIEMFLRFFSGITATVGVVMMTCGSFKSPKENEHLIESLVSRRRKKIYFTKEGTAVVMLGIKVDQNGAFSAAIDTIDVNK